MPFAYDALHPGVDTVCHQTTRLAHKNRRRCQLELTLRLVSDIDAEHEDRLGLWLQFAANKTGSCILERRPVPIFGDSSGVIALVFNPVDHQANKHIRVADHYARELTKEGVIAPHRVASALNRADMFTKPLQGAAFKNAAAREEKSQRGKKSGRKKQQSICL